MVRSFTGRYHFLSNFYSCEIVYKRRVWPTAEHLFQALKTESQMSRMRIRKLPTPAKAKRAGRQVVLRPNWDSIKLDVMRMVLYLKFQQDPMLKLKLLGTGAQILVEGNYWHDNFWGDCECKKCESITGKNRLGLLLMQLREKLLKVK